MKRIDAKTDAEIESMSLVPDGAHDWWVYSTAIGNHVLLVECRKTGERGYVPDPTPEEWRQAFHAPSNPYRWTDQERIIIDATICPPFTDEIKLEALRRSSV